MKTVMIDGGLGRVICSSGVISLLGNSPKVITSWIDVFEFNSSIDKQYPMNHCWLYEDAIKGNEFVQPEPYYSLAYMQQKHHLSQSFNFLLTGNESLVYPNIVLTPREQAWAVGFVQNIRETLKKDLIAAYQPFGASFSDMGDDTGRSLSFGDAKFIASSVDVGCLNCSNINMDHPNVWHREFSVRELFAVVSACDLVIGIDSSVQHIGASFGKPGVVILGGTYAENVGWPHYLHVSKSDYPKSYFANRFTGFKNMNSDAMSFTGDQLQNIVSMVNDRKWNDVLLPTSHIVESPVFTKEVV